ncbi:TIGR01244 family sulfur transferase [Pontibaca methylaminivorans]|uniref:TIGR01244 family sulfur transferase n=1 Tax=Pontibaca methylaminivorans TaxID=515897 RepID=UPI002FDA16D9
MDIRQITPRYHVAPQITPDDLPGIAAAGFSTGICNRPDSEIPPEIRAADIQAAAEKAGLAFERLELTRDTMTPDNIARQNRIIEAAPGPVLAYCATGTRCTMIWALGQAGHMPVDEILATALRGGYDLGFLRPVLEQLAR